MSRRSRLFVGLLVGLLAMSSTGRVVAGPALVEYRPPVDAPITDSFRAPEHRYGPGNRGIEYASAPGTPVRAVAAGEVTFAGQVGGTLHVTVLHEDGLRSTLSYLDRVEVRRGDLLALGDTVGVAGSRTHLGIRNGDEYLDPAALLTAGSARVRLVPTEAVRLSVAAERAAIASWMAARPGLFERSADWLRGRAVDAVSLVDALPDALDPAGFGIRTGLALFERLSDRPPCTPPSDVVPAPPGRRVVVLVGGLGSDSANAAVDAVDVEALGYQQSDVYRFSYRGGRTPDPTDARQDIHATSYTSGDSQADLVESGERLGALIEELARLEPGVEVDVVAHSQGGLVARLALVDLASTGDGEALGAVVTLGTPHQGADLATAALAVRADRSASGIFSLVGGAAGTGLALDSPALRQLAVGSPVIDALDRQGVPPGVRLTSVGARGDLVVAANRSWVDGAANITVPLTGLDAHDALPADPAVTREIGLAIAGSAPTCEPTGDIVLDVLSGRLVSHTEQLLAVGVILGGAPVPD